MFVDASAMVAILTGEAEADRLIALLEAAQLPITSPIAVFEAVAAVARKSVLPIEEAEQVVAEFLQISGTEIVPVSALDGETAIGAFARFGKGRGHPAQLNLGDCFAYAVALNRKAPIFCVGDDFRRTDLPVAGNQK
jgi:ribonuclease VapC